ncbi:MAG: hypothetical protein KAQ96_04130, partial [Thermoplasmata archaeon]|nr:hypothetical protein [Thermoplasmata archaeon]
NAANKANLAEHLLGCHKTFMPYLGQIPKTTTSMAVLYRINATDLSNLSTLSSTYEYTTDASPPSYLFWTPPPTPAAWDQSDIYRVYAKIKDTEGLGGVTLYYSLNGGATWSSRAMSFSTGSSTEANYTTTIPSTGSSSWVNYYYQAFDRSGNSARKPTSGVFSYQTSDSPSFASIISNPTVGSLQSSVRITATITDPDVVSLARAYYRFGTSGAWTEVNCTAGTNDRWYTDVAPPTTSGTMYYYFTARDTIGVWATSSTSNYFVDGTLPTAEITAVTPQYPSATDSVIINGSVYDDRGLVTANFQYKYGVNGTVTNVTSTGTGGRHYIDRNPSSGMTSSYLSRYYYMSDELGYLNLYIHSSDDDSIWIRVRAWRPSYGWTNLYYDTWDDNGTKIDTSYVGMGYTQFHVYMYEQYDGDGYDYIYYRVSYTDGDPYVNATIPGPGYSSWVYYSLSATDQAGNTNSTTWSR